MRYKKGVQYAPLFLFLLSHDTKNVILGRKSELKCFTAHLHGAHYVSRG